MPRTTARPRPVPPVAWPPDELAEGGLFHSGRQARPGIGNGDRGPLSRDEAGGDRQGAGIGVTARVVDQREDGLAHPTGIGADGARLQGQLQCKARRFDHRPQQRRHVLDLCGKIDAGEPQFEAPAVGEADAPEVRPTASGPPPA
jgi:hypothetical protein